MTARTWTATCAALALGTTMTAFAQDPARPQTPPYPQTASQAKAITVTGCVDRAQPGTTTGTTGTTGTTTEPKFVLKDASMSPSGTAGTSGTAAAPAATEYRLNVDDSKISAHVGHKVEITGTVESMSRPEQKPPTASSTSNAPTLKVTDIKMIASSCQ